MSTTTEAASGAQGSAIDGMPFARVFRTELRKLVDTRASRALLAGMVVLTPAVVLVTLLVADHDDLTYDDLVNYCQTPQKVLLPAIAILAITSEWSQRTALTTFTLVPDRRRILAAKLASIVVVALCLTLLILGSAAVGMAVAPATGESLHWDFGPVEALSMFVIQVVGALEGAGIGLLVLSSAGAVVAFYVVPNLWSLLLNAVGFQDHASWVDINQALGNLYGHEQGGTAVLQLLTAAALWVLLPVVVGTWRVVRAEPK
jgi:ABC-2 type transport system permease protein